MENKVIIEGQVVRYAWGKNEDSGFFVTIKHERMVDNLT
jgi:hypothetical protein